MCNQLLLRDSFSEESAQNYQLFYLLIFFYFFYLVLLIFSWLSFQILVLLLKHFVILWFWKATKNMGWCFFAMISFMIPATRMSLKFWDKYMRNEPFVVSLWQTHVLCPTLLNLWDNQSLRKLTLTLQIKKKKTNKWQKLLYLPEG